MGDKSSFLSLAISDAGTDASSVVHARLPEGVAVHADEVLPAAGPSPARSAPPAQERTTSLLSVASAPPVPHSTNEEFEDASREAEHSPPPLHDFFSVRPSRAVASVSPEEEDALTQRRWWADAAEVESFLTQLDLAREECARAGLYSKAQACMRRMEQAMHLFAARLHEETDAVAHRTRQRMAEQHKREQLELRKQWREAAAAYKRDATALLAATQQHHYAALEKEDMHMRAELRSCTAGVDAQEDVEDCGETRCLPAAARAASPSHTWSKEAQHLQMELQQYLRQRRYTDAERVRAQLRRVEKQESTDHHRIVTQRHLQRLQAMKAEQASKLADLQAAQRLELQELVCAGRDAQEALRQRQMTALQALDDRRLYLHEQTRAAERSYAQADVLDPKTTGLKLIRLSQLLWNPVKSVASSSKNKSV